MSRKKTEENKYEVGYLASPLLTVEEALKLAETIKNLIEKAGGKVTSELTPAILPLSYKVAKVVNHKRSAFSEAYFGAIHSQMAPAIAENLQLELNKSEVVLRFMIITLKKDAEPLSEVKRPVIKVKREDRVYHDEPVAETAEVVVENKVVEPIDEEALDKKIDDLVSEESTI